MLLNNYQNKRATDDPSIRRYDPSCWECLSDEQRDVIHEWYNKLNAEKQEAEKKKINRVLYSSYFALIPFAVAHAFKWSDGELTWNFLFTAICAWIIYALIFGIFSQAFQSANSEGFPSKPRLIFHILVAVFVTLCVLTCIY